MLNERGCKYVYMYAYRQEHVRDSTRVLEPLVDAVEVKHVHFAFSKRSD